MSKKLSITLDDDIHDALRELVGEESVSKYIESVLRPRLIKTGLAAAYKAMGQDEARQRAASEWSESVIGDDWYETR